MTGCDGFCAAASPWWIVAAQLFAIAASAFLGARRIRVAGAALVAYAYVGGF